jgi:hypothetical protein
MAGVVSHSTTRWRDYGNRTPEQVEAELDALSRTRALTLEESLKLEWAITEQVNGKRRLNGRYIALRSRIEDLALADKLEDEMVVRLQEQGLQMGSD